MNQFFSGEVQCCGWVDSSARGPTVTLRLQSSEELEPFRGLTLAKGGIRGDRFACVLVRILDDETLEGDRPHKGFPEGLCGLACRWCADPDFRQWLSVETQQDVPDEAAAREQVLAICGITSRKALNDDPVAASLFESVLKEPYSMSRKERGLDD